MNWPIVPLGEVVSFLSGYAFKSNYFNTESRGLPIIRIRDVVRGSSQTFFDGDYDPRYIVQNGDFLIGMDGEFNLSQWRGGTALLNQRVCKVDKVSEQVSRDYIAKFLPLALKKIEDETPFVTVKHLSTKTINQIPIPLPPLEEQRRIAAILDQAEELRAKRRAAIALLDQLPQAIFLEMFGDPATNPKGWPVGSLTDPSVARIFGGGTPSRAIPAYYDGNICWATSKDIKRELLMDTQEHVTAEAVARSATKLVPRGSILVVVKSKILARTLPLAISQVPICFGQDLKGIVPKNSESVYFLFHSLKAGERWLLERARGINTEGLTLDHLRDFPLFVPPADLQGHFGTKVKAIHYAKAAHQSALNELDALFASLQSKAFSGEISEKDNLVSIS
jgi:type I restriction enzyme, S subunit